MGKYKLSDGRVVEFDENDENAKQTFQQKLTEKNLTAELITDEPGKDQGANPPQNNQDENTESPSEDTSSDLQFRQGSEDEGDFSHGKTWTKTGVDADGEETWEWVDNKKISLDAIEAGVAAPQSSSMINELSEEEKKDRISQISLNPRWEQTRDNVLTEDLFLGTEEDAAELIGDNFADWGIIPEEKSPGPDVTELKTIDGKSSIQIKHTSLRLLKNNDPEEYEKQINLINSWVDRNANQDAGYEDAAIDMFVETAEVTKDQLKEINTDVNKTTDAVKSYAKKLNIENKSLEEVLHIWGSIQGTQERDGGRSKGTSWYSDFVNEEKFGKPSKEELQNYIALLGDDIEKFDKGGELGIYDNKSNLATVIKADEESRKNIATQRFIEQYYGGNVDEFNKDFMDKSTADKMGYNKPIFNKNADYFEKYLNEWTLLDRKGNPTESITEEEALKRGLLNKDENGNVTAPISAVPAIGRKTEVSRTYDVLYNDDRFKDIINNLELSEDERSNIMNNVSNTILREKTEEAFNSNLRDEIKDLGAGNMWSEEQVQDVLEKKAKGKLNDISNEIKEFTSTVDRKQDALESNADRLVSLQEDIANFPTGLENVVVEIAEDLNITNQQDFWTNEEAIKRLSKFDKDYVNKLKEFNTLSTITIPAQYSSLSKDINKINELQDDQVKLMIAQDALSRNHEPVRVFSTEALATTLDIVKTLTMDLPDALLSIPLEMGISENTWLGNAQSFVENRSDTVDESLEMMRSSIRRPMQFNNIDSAADFGDWFTHMAGGQAPILAAIMASGGYALPLLGTYSGASKYKDLRGYEKLHGVDLNAFHLYGNALLTGTTEALSERITLGQVKYFKRAFAGNKGMLGFDSAIKRNIYSPKNIAKATGKTIFDAASEGTSEVLAGISSRGLDLMMGVHDGSIWDGVGEEFVSGKLISISLKTPWLAKGMIQPFTRADENQSMATRANMIEKMVSELGAEMPNYKKGKQPDGPASYEIDGKTVSQKEMLDFFLSGKYDNNQYKNIKISNDLAMEDMQNATPTNRKKIAKVINLLDAQNDQLQKQIKRVDMLTPEEKMQLVEFDKQNFAARKDAEEAMARSGIYADMTDAEITGVIQGLQAEVDARADKKDAILNQYNDKDIQSKYMEDVNAIIQKTAEKAKEFGAPDLVVEEVNQKEFEQEVAKYEFGDKQAQAEDVAAESEAMVEAMDEVINDKDATQEEVDAAKELKSNPETITNTLGNILTNDSYGVMQPQVEDGKLTGVRILINKDTALEDGKINTAAHEFIHAIFHNTLKQDPEAQMRLGNEVIDILNGPGVVFSSRQKQRVFNKRIQGQNGEEVMAIASEMMADGDIIFKDTPLQKLKNVFNLFSNATTTRDISFNNKEDIKNFMKDYHTSIKTNKVNPAIARMMAKGANGKIFKDARTPEQRRDQQQFSRVVEKNLQANPDLKAEFDNLVKTDGTKKHKNHEDFKLSPDYIEGYNKIVDSKLLDGLIQQGMTERGLPPDALKDFTRKVKEGLGIRYLNNFDLNKNESLFGWLTGVSGGAGMSIIYRAKGDVINEYLKEEVLKGPSIDQAIGESTTIADMIESDKDAMMDQIENADMSVTAKKEAKDVLGDLKMVMDLLGFPGKVKKAVKEAVEEANVPLDGLTYKGIRDLLLSTEGKVTTEKKATPTGPLFGVLNAISSEFGVDPLRILAKQDLNGEQRKLAQQYIFDKAVNEDGSLNNNIIKALPEGTDVDGKATGVANTKLGDFYTKGERAKMKTGATAAGLATQTKRTDITKEEFLKMFGVNTDGSLMPGTKADGAIRELVVQISQLAANQEIRLNAIENDLAVADIIARIGVGKSQQMFSERVTEEMKRFAKLTPNKALTEKYGEFEKYKRTSTVLSPSRKGGMKEKKVFEFIEKRGKLIRTIMSQAVKELGPGVLSVLKTSMTYGLGRSTFGKVGTFMKYSPMKTLEKLFTRTKYGENYQSKEIQNIVNNKQAKKEYIESQKQEQEYMIEVLDFLNKLKGDGLGFHERVLLDASSNMDHIFRTGAIHIGVLMKKDGSLEFNIPTREEHMIPQNAIGTMYIANPELAKKVIRLGYGQIPLSKYDDDLVNKEYKTTMPDFFYDVIVPRINEGKLDWVPAGLASIVRYTKSGINLNKYQLFETGESIPAAFGVGIDGMNLNQKEIDHLVPFQNYLIEQVLAGNITKAEAGKALKKNIKLAKSMKRSKDKMKSFVNAKQAFSRKIDNANRNVTKGMSTFDFDDTLAKTKSGVRARVPNADGQPKPNRKVIFLAGGAGSGKGNVISKLGLAKQGFKVVNSDISLEWLKKNSGLPENMNELTKVQRSTLGKLQHQARGIARRKMMKYQGKADGVVIDGTGGSVNSMKKLVDEFQSKGYDVSMLFVDTSLDVALERNRARKERSLLDKIVERNHEAVQKNKVNFKTMFADRFMEVNTDNLSMDSPMPDLLVNQMEDFVNGYEKLRLDAEEFAAQGDNILERGGEFDFSEFNDVVDGKPGPLLNKARDRAKKYGTKDMFVLTARPQASAPAIQEFLKSQGLNIPIENITGLANSSGNAKAEWMLSKFAEGYNDMYFVDDALQNVEAVKTVLDQLDIKSKVVQAFSQRANNMNKEFNDMIQRKKGVPSEKVMTEAEAKKRGKGIGKWRLYIPPSAEDFKGLMYYFLGKGKQGDADMRFFEEVLFKPFGEGIRAWNTYKQNMVDDYQALKKKYPDVKKELNKRIPDSIWTTDTAIRMYLWNKSGFDIPGTDQATIDELVNYVNINPDIKAFADALSIISKRSDGYLPPSENWSVESIPTDLRSIVDTVGRKEFLEEWINNKNVIFSPVNLSKIKATYGDGFVEALNDILYRMENGTNRIQGQSKVVNRFTEWINGSVGAIMFFNMRSALLQTMSTVNFINWSDNNIFKASAAFANQPQFWKDFAMLFNSDMLKQRRRGLQTDVSASELTKSFAENGYSPRTVINYLLQIGFTPTQAVDSFAIAFGGASMFRNRYKKYIKEGKSPKEASEQAMLDWQEVAESTQQSSREDLISQQQAGPLGRIILAFQNVTMQYGRLTKKALSDLVNGRGDTKTNISKIIYYGAVQNIIFAALQSALAFIMWGDDEEEIANKTQRTFNSALDSFLRGTGLYGALISTLKNTAIQWHIQSQKDWGKERLEKVALELINLSPPIGSKVRKIINAYYADKYNRGVGEELGWRIENPNLGIAANLIEAIFNIPLARIVNKANNVEEALTGQHETWKRIAMLFGWNRWDLGVEDEELEEARDKAKIKNKEKKKIEDAKQKEIDKKKEEEEKKAKGIKTVRCSGRKSSGGRCSLTTETTAKTWKCYHHMEFKDGMDRDGDGVKEYRCKGKTRSGARCKNKTENKSKRCYAHQ